MVVGIIVDKFVELLTTIYDYLGIGYLFTISSFFIRKGITFCCCTFLAIQIFFVGYYFMIPNMQQELTLHFQKDNNDNFLGYYFNQDHKDKICYSLLNKSSSNQQNTQFNNQDDLDLSNGGNDSNKESEIFNEDLDDDKIKNKQKKKQSGNRAEDDSVKKHAYQEIKSDLNTLCNIHIHNQRQELYFERESYQMNLRLTLFDLQNKGFGKGVIPLEITIIDRNGESLQMKKVIHFNQNQKKRNLLQRIIDSFGSRIANILGLQVDENQYEIDQILFEKLANTLIDLQGIIIKIQDVGIFVQSSQLIVNPILKGVRYYLYYWFYSTSIIIILAISIYLFLLYYIYQCFKPCLQECFCPKKRNYHYD